MGYVQKIHCVIVEETPIVVLPGGGGGGGGVYMKNIFQSEKFLTIVRVLTWRAQKMPSAIYIYKFRRPTIGQNCSAVCTNKGGRFKVCAATCALYHTAREMILFRFSLSM